MRVAGVEVGRIADVKLEEGVAVVTLEIKPEYKNLIRQDATRAAAAEDRAEGHVRGGGPGSRQAGAGRRHDHRGELAAGHQPGRDLLGARRRHAPVPEAARGGSGEGPEEPRRRPPRGVPPPRADPPRPRAGDARDRRAAARAEGADPRLRPPDDRARQASAGPAPARDRLAHRVRHAREGGHADLRVRRAAAGLAERLRRARSRTCGGSRRCCAASLESLRPAIRKLPETNAAVTPFLRETEPVLRTADPAVRARGAAVDERPALRRGGHGEGHARPEDLVRRAEPLLQHGRVQPGRRGEPRRQVDLAAAPAPGGPPLLARVGGPERHVAVLDGRRAGPVAPGDDLRRPGPRAQRDRAGRRQRRGREQPGARTTCSPPRAPAGRAPPTSCSTPSSAPATSTPCRPCRPRTAAAASRSSATSPLPSLPTP